MANTETKIKVLTFASDKVVPIFKEYQQAGKRWVNYGSNNLYPNYLLDLFKKSPKHGSIVKLKTKFVAGGGFDFADAGSDKVNSFGESSNKILKKIASDLEIFNGFALKIVYTKGKGVAEVIHLPFQKVRSNLDNSKFFTKDDWSSQKEKPKEYDAFNPQNPTGEQVIYYKEYFAGLETYTNPDYIQAQNYIESDILVSGHVFNNAKSGFTGSKLIVFTDGEPTDEERRQIETDLGDKFSGEAGSKLVVAFVNNKDKAPIVEDLGASDLTKEDFTRVDDLISQNIFIGHNITSPMLFGVRVEGQLGGREELLEAFEIFTNTYIKDRQQSIEEVFNVIRLLNKKPETKILPFEILKPAEVKKEDSKQSGAADEKKDENKDDKKKEDFTAVDDALAVEMFSQVGKPKDTVKIIKSKKVDFTNDDDCETSELKFSNQFFNEVTQLQANILDALKKDKRATPEVIAKALGVDERLVIHVLSDLENKGLIKEKTERVGDDEQTVRIVTEGGTEAVAEKKSSTSQVFIRYSYEGIKDDRNRPFCSKMLELDKIYSRAEIELISQRLGYSVWERRGGFYTNPKTGETTPYCRHHWEQHIVIKKK